MKRILLVLAACLFAFALLGCNKVEEGKKDINKAKEAAVESQKAVDAVKQQAEQQMGDNKSGN